MAAPSSWRRCLVAFVLLVGSCCSEEEHGLLDETALVQVTEGVASLSTHAQAASEMINKLLSLINKASAGQQNSWALKEQSPSQLSGPAGCSWPEDYQGYIDHMMELMPEMQHATLSIMVPKMIEVANRKAMQAQEPPEDVQEANKKEMTKKMKAAMMPLQEEFMPPECDQKEMKKKVMAQSVTGGADAEEMTLKCMMKLTRTSATCARCTSNFLRDFMGRGMMGLANSCVPSCSPANNACKKGFTTSCLTKGHTCLKCMKPGMLKYASCIGVNTTRFNLPDKIDLLSTALRDLTTTEEGYQKFVDDIVLALNA